MNRQASHLSAYTVHTHTMNIHDMLRRRRHDGDGLIMIAVARQWPPILICICINTIKMEIILEDWADYI